MKQKIFVMGLLGFLGLLGPMGPMRIWAADLGGGDVTGLYQIVDSQAVDGDVVVNSQNGIKRATTAYDNNIFGVLTEKPLVVFRSGEAGGKPVVRTGIAQVNVVTANGAIKTGDYLTSSAVVGKAQRADRSGYVLGVALGSFNGEAASAGAAVNQGQIPVALRIEYAELTTARNANRLLEYLGASFFSNAQNPEKFGQIVRYILAGLVLLFSLAFGFITFSRALPKAVEAVGRNPLAKNTIYISMAFNVGLIVVVGILGIAGSFLILRL